MYFFATGGVEISPIHRLPETISAEGIFADQQAGALLHGVAGTSFSDADEAIVSFHNDDISALVKEGLAGVGTACGVSGRLVVADAGDLGFGQASGVGAVG